MNIYNAFGLHSLLQMRGQSDNIVRIIPLILIIGSLSILCFRTAAFSNHFNKNYPIGQPLYRTHVPHTVHRSSSSADLVSTASNSNSAKTNDVSSLLEDDWLLVGHLSQYEGDKLDDAVAGKIPEMHPRLMVALQKVVHSQFTDSLKKGIEEKRFDQLKLVGLSLARVLDARLQSGKTLLKEFLDAGELRKLDSMIARAAKDGKMDMAFFSVLNMNIRDASVEASQLSDEEKKKLMSSIPPENGGGASRLQILQHIYTRCQEEVEKNVNPGVALLNKLLRTDIASIRSNLLNHYLCPQSNVITTPDGTTVELQGQSKALIPPQDLVEALSNAITKIRTIEKAGGSDRVAAANLVENCRQVAIEARQAILNAYGMDSSELNDFEESLQKVFRPASSESKYIRGE